MTNLPRLRFILTSLAAGVAVCVIQRLINGSDRSRLPEAEVDAAPADNHRGVTTANRKTLRHTGRAAAAEAAADRRIAVAALELLERDADLDDEVYTPPAAMSLCIDAPIQMPGDRRGDVFGGVS